MNKEELKEKIKNLEERIKQHRIDHKLDEESTSDYVKMMRDPSDLESILYYWKNKLNE